MRPTGTVAELERRRRLALSKLHDGYTVAEIAEFLGVSERAVYLWKAAERRHGDDGVKAKPPRAGKLTARQERIVLSWFCLSPKSFGFATNLWTGRRVAQVIQRKWNIQFNWRYLLGWLKDRGITSKPQRQARESDRAAVDRWRTRDWPSLKNGPDASGPPLSSSTKAASC